MKKDMLFGYVTEGVHEWQLYHICKGVEAARGGEFAADAEVEEFFRRYGNDSHIRLNLSTDRF